MVRRDLRLVASMLAFLTTFATIGADDIPQGVMPKRQVAGTGASTTSQQSTTSSSSSNSPITSNTPTSASSTPTTQDTTSQTQQQSSSSVPTTVAVVTTKSDGSVITTSISTNTLVGSSTKAVQTSENSAGNTVVKVGSTTINPSTLSHKTTVRQPLVTHETKHSTYTSFWTSNGHVYSSVYTTENVFASTTGFVTATIAPGLANSGGSGANLSTNSKKIIGGVVGGIGGAILIGGLAFVAWRLWGKKRTAANEGQGDFYDGSQTDSLAGAKRESMGVLSNSGMSESGLGTGTSTQTTGLERYERYQNPNGGINTASNF